MAELPTIKFPSSTLPKANVARQYVPPNWTDQKALYAITFQHPLASTGLASESVITGENIIPPDFNVPATLNPDFKYNATFPGATAGYNAETQMNMFVFDAIKRAHHQQIMNVTQHPLQTGFNISDHAIKQPQRLSLEVGMSDAIASYTLAGYTPMWTLDKSKSVSAYQQMQILMDNRVLMDINTRLKTYFNMLLVEISVEDTIRTYFGGLAMVLNFQEVFVADVSEMNNGARIQTTDETTQGAVQPQPPSKPVVAQHKITTFGTPAAPILTVPDIFPGIPGGTLSDIANWIARGMHVPGAGTWTSNVMSGKAPGPIPLGF